MTNYEFRLFKTNDELPKGNLPENSYKFHEPDSLLMVNIIALLYAIPLFLVIAYIAWQRGQVVFYGDQARIGILLSLFMVLPHEFLHAVCFPKKARKYIIAAPKSLIFAVLCTAPVSKARYIFLSFLPNLVFGCLPLLFWLVLPISFHYSQLLLSFATMSILCGCGDYMNIVHAYLQMPKHSMQQLSGIHSYWFMQEEL